MVLPGFVEFFVSNKLVIGFYLLVALLVFLNRKKFEFQAKVIGICRTKLGIGLMERIAKRHGRLVRFLGYIGIGFGFLGMVMIVALLGFSVFSMLKSPGGPAQIAPIIPGVHVPGTPKEFSIPFIEGIIAIFVIAVVHEFSHGVVSAAHGVKVKSSGPALFGPIFAAFVEPDEVQLRKKGFAAQYSVFAAGSFSNILLAVLLAIVWVLALVPLGSSFFPPNGVSLISVEPGAPASMAGLSNGTIINSIDGKLVNSTNDVLAILKSTAPNQTVVFNDGNRDFPVVAGSRPDFGGRGYFGIYPVNHYRNEGSFMFNVFAWLVGLINLTFGLSIGIGLANMIPAGPLDGGKMLHLVLSSVRGEKNAGRLFIQVSLFILVVILFLLSPIFKAILAPLLGVF